MPDSKGWRKIGHNKPKKQTKAKELTPLKITNGGPPTNEDHEDRRHHPSWRKTITSSRPATPVSAKPTTPANDDAEDTRSERSDTSGPRRDSKPKLARYTSLFNNFKEKEKDAPKGPEFSEPWSEDDPLPFLPYTDPLEVLQAVRSHMMNSSKPIPVEHNSGLFRVFEDYRKVRERKELLNTMLQETFEGWGIAEKHWESSKSRYKAEVRRLELLIAGGTSGMTGLMIARKGSLIAHKRQHRKTISNDNAPPLYDFMSQQQLDDEIKMRSQRVLLHRPASPSGKMIALSKRFTNRSVELPVGNPPEEKRKMTLSRKVQSELNLASLTTVGDTQSITSSAASGFSESTGDPLPDEATMLNSTTMKTTIECEALVALRELGTLVARRQGLRVDKFNNGLMELFSTTKGPEAPFQSINEEDEDMQTSPLHKSYEGSGSQQDLTPRRPLRKFQSQPQLNMKRKHRRQFSFEPGADQLQALKDEFGTHNDQILNSESDDSDTPLLLQAHRPTLDSQSTNSASSLQTLNADFDKPSKIPSPVQASGRVHPRRENSASSQHSVYVGSEESRRDSRSSVTTAFEVRTNSSGNVRPSQSRTGSRQNILAADNSRDQSGRTRLRNNAMALAAARAAGNGSQSSLSEGGSLSRSSSRPPAPQAVRPAGPVKSENSDSKKGRRGQVNGT